MEKSKRNADRGFASTKRNSRVIFFFSDKKYIVAAVARGRNGTISVGTID